MSIAEARERFIDRTARKPEGEWAVKSYKNPRGHFRSFRIIMELLDLKPEDSYCEIGCGGGVLLKMALEKAGRGAAMDHSDDMLRLAIDNNNESVLAGRLHIIKGDAGDLPWPSDSFTACGCANMFFFIEEPEAVLAEICRVLKPGGRFAMATMGKSIIGKLTFGLLYGLRTYSDTKMTCMLSNAGFNKIRVKTGLAGMQICYAEKSRRD